MMELESMAVEMPEVEGHPNRAGFRGVLTVVDVASQRAPSGSKGRRVVLTRAAAEAALPSLLGMALDYAPEFDRHDQRRKVGVITSAEVVGRNLEVGGYLYAKDFPEIVEEIAGATPRGQGSVVRGQESRSGDSVPALAAKGAAGIGHSLRVALATAAEGIRELARSIPGGKIATLRQAQGRLWGTPGVRGGLGMSFEVSDVTVMDTRARVWILTHVVFTGAAILRRDKAAYEDTWIELV